jgi:hypothetical protein
MSIANPSSNLKLIFTCSLNGDLALMFMNSHVKWNYYNSEV